MIEVWVDIEGIPFYQVSNKGNFRSITREVTVTSTRQRPYKKIINGTSEGGKPDSKQPKSEN